MNTIYQDLNTIEETLSRLEKDTPLIDTAYSFKRPLTEDEIRDFESQVAKITIGILNDQERQKEIADRIKAATQERNNIAYTLESGNIEEVAKAIKFYQPADNMLAIFAETENGYNFIHSRTATPAEIQEWKRLQEEIKQTEIEAGNYRRELYKIAGYDTDKALI